MFQGVGAVSKTPSPSTRTVTGKVWVECRVPFSKGRSAGSCPQATGQRSKPTLSWLCLACRLVRCFCRRKPTEVATGDPHHSESAKPGTGCIFDGAAVKSAFALLLTRVTEPRMVFFKERKRIYAKDDKRMCG